MFCSAIADVFLFFPKVWHPPEARLALLGREGGIVFGSCNRSGSHEAVCFPEGLFRMLFLRVRQPILHLTAKLQIIFDNVLFCWQISFVLAKKQTVRIVFVMVFVENIPAPCAVNLKS